MIGIDVASALPDLRAAAASLMQDACNVSRPGEPTWNEEIGQHTPGVPVLVYAGKCQVQVPESVPGAPVAGEAEWAAAAVVVKVPVPGSESVKVGATVTITSAALDAGLVGQEYTVVGIPLAKTYATSRRLRCEAVAR